MPPEPRSGGPEMPRLAPQARILKAREVSLCIEAVGLLRQAHAALADARREADAIRAEARRRGREKGLDEAAAVAARIVAAAQAQAGAMMDAALPALADAAQAAIVQILGGPKDSGTVALAVRAALGRAKRHRHVRLFVAPGALEAVRAAAEAGLAGRDDGAELVSVEADPRLTPGRVVLASEHGYVELGPAQQVEVARDAILATLREEARKTEGGEGAA